MRKKIIPLLMLAVFQVGCDERYVYQDPAPVYRRPHTTVTQKAPPVAETYKYPDEPIAQSPNVIKEEAIIADSVPVESSESVTPDASSVPRESSVPIDASVPPAAEPTIPAM
ncbi:MAG: hypothetical protein HOP02_02155, partial [Methylococcaceae bacterium]|nr:hypothetical protein [Methylococcaceae bacterium]